MEKGPLISDPFSVEPLRAGDLASLQAGGADVQALGGGPDDRADPLDIGIPTTLRAAMGVRDIVPEARALPADVAVGGHSVLLMGMDVGGGPPSNRP